MHSSHMLKFSGGGRGGVVEEGAKVLHHRADVFGLCAHECVCFPLPSFNLTCLLEVDTRSRF